MDKFKKYRAIEKYTYSSDSPIFYCVYEKTENIIVRNPLLEDTIWNQLGKPRNTELGRFANHRHAIRSVKLEPWEADVIKSLLE